MSNGTRRSTRIRAEQHLQQLFSETGYVRRADEARRQTDGASYKKGYEVRLVVKTEAELEELRQWLVQAGFKLAKPFAKGHQFVQPVYGRAAVEWFLAAASA